MKHWHIIPVALFLCLTSINHPSHAWYPLNDTGIQFCGESSTGNNNPCTGREPQGQDAHYGRDAAARAGTLNKVGAGAGGFDFTKISNSGRVLPATAKLGSGPNEWACTRDNVTGIIWEVKVNNPSHPRHIDHTYTWFFSRSPDGIPGYRGRISTCRNTLGGQSCNTESYVNHINSIGLCGSRDWRVPSIKELESISNFQQNIIALDLRYFPDFPSTYSAFYWWSSTASAIYDLNSWGVDSGIGSTMISHRSFDFFRIRLARGGKNFRTFPAAFCKNNFLPSNPNSAYLMHLNGTVTDKRTRLNWKRCSEGQVWNGRTCLGEAKSYSWDEALMLARTSTFAGHSDWRIPNVKELRSLVEECRSVSPKINPIIFPATPDSFFWSSSPSLTSNRGSWHVTFNRGTSSFGGYTRDYEHYIRLVRGGQPPALQGLRILIEPPQVRQAGAWRKVGTQAWRPHGFMERLAAGPHAIQFRPVQGWRQPPNRRVAVQQNRLMTIQAQYTIPQGLRVIIEPVQARQAGAAWRKVSTQAWRPHGFMERLTAGSHTIQFRPVQGWRQPPNRQVAIQQNRLMTVQARYSRP